MKAGVLKRLACATPKADVDVLRRFKVHNIKWLKENLVPLSPETDVGLETWLAETDYPDWRRQELRKCWAELPSLKLLFTRRYRRCKSFMKDECYAEYKHARGINSRTDEFKCAVGPVFKCIENVVYKHQAFIKHVPVKDRPAYIKDLLYSAGQKYFATDYTGFEGLLKREIMLVCEVELYRYMTQYLSIHNDFMEYVYIIAGINECDYKNFNFRILGTRMSGEMCTSLGNSFSNLMFMLFMCKECGCTDVLGIVEGDDGLFRMNGTPPSSDQFAKLGLVIKAELHDQISTASFCGIVFDENDLVNVTDPRSKLASFGWTTNRYANARPGLLKTLLRCKSLSMAYQYPRCPILDAMAHYGLRMTRSYDIRHHVQNSRNIDEWQRQLLKSALKDEKNIVRGPVPDATRLLVEQKYGITMEDQRSIEKYFDELEVLQPLEKTEIDLMMNPIWKDYFSKYSLDINATSQIRRPPTHWNKMAGFVPEFAA